MTAPGDPVVVLMTGPDPATLEAIAGEIVEARLAACVNLIPGVRSVYRWEGKVRRDDEVLAMVKTTRPALEGLRRRIERLHPYEVPEFLVLPVTDGSGPYLEWIADSVGGTRGGESDGRD